RQGKIQIHIPQSHRPRLPHYNTSKQKQWGNKAKEHQLRAKQIWVTKKEAEEIHQARARMAELGRVAGSAPADPDPKSGQTRPESGRVGLSRDSKPVPTVPWVGRCSPPRVGSPGADPTQSRPTLPSMGPRVHPK
ncbi:hypothetical protein Taro_000248, partial [Colocasia esculenta]|nr:hypothetical protein [Colocasia esculenta]